MNFTSDAVSVPPSMDFNDTQLLENFSPAPFNTLGTDPASPLILLDTIAPALVDTMASTMIPPFKDEFIDCFAQKDFHELLSTTQCRFVLGLLIGSAITIFVILAFCFTCVCCYVGCRIHRKRKMRRNHTIRSDSMLDLAIPKKISPPLIPPRNAVLRDHRIPRATQHAASEYGPTDDVFATELSHRPLQDTMIVPPSNRFSSFSSYAPPPPNYANRSYRASDGALIYGHPAYQATPDLFAVPNPNGANPNRLSTYNTLYMQQQKRTTTMPRHAEAPFSTLQHNRRSLSTRPMSCFELAPTHPMAAHQNPGTLVVREEIAL
ncbi:hypothetical protein L596_027520 [Steinernema carpocapsae]|uniref:Uncharacterized protein n=1 Tax=Steinernema carpocapsae TaxID=34508 RepID=A0A4U5LVR6_STECR|nr:hypothetical protein L596_027520 [Steinernema carpocapsae]